ncbi:MAG: DNA alkylation repair protein [Candidatus Marinimicrobia bacterium]|nr:DNA alkylation repair protein [Candidatus Neomarinimicrobiota bacterium]
MESIQSTIKFIEKRLKELGDPSKIPAMAQYGITPEQTYGVKVPHLREIAHDYRKNHEMALALWQINNRETRILASMIDDPKQLTEDQMEAWAMEFSYWEICDQACMNLFEKHPLAWQKAIEWSNHENEGKKRAAFVLMARLVVSDKKAADEKFTPFFPLIIHESTDERNLVKKAVNWALRQIGKRNKNLNQKAIPVAEKIATFNSKSARWIAADALRELKSEAVQERLEG